jgi:phosphoribosylformylglycinamidine synthase
MSGVGVPCMRIGNTGGDAISIAGEAAVLVKALEGAFESWLPAYMNGKAS